MKDGVAIIEHNTLIGMAIIAVVVVGAVTAIAYGVYSSPTNKAMRNQARERARNTERSRSRRSGGSEEGDVRN